ncbi:cation transporter [uncultured Nocardioides sp.]|uniref:heavy-metal-associated domain-containing protein n=1 Tax=uncultured Nocardioides sp. TaxID=198441 RepID=UPI0030F9D91A
MSTTDTSRNLQLIDTSAAAAGCGCGSDTGGSADTPEVTPTAATKETTMTTSTYAVTGMTCGHCASAVTSELKTLEGVTDVAVDLVAGGTSSVTVTSTRPLEETQVAAALDEAGDYHLT